MKVQNTKLSVLLSFSNKQPLVYSDFHLNGCQLITGLTVNEILILISGYSDRGGRWLICQ